MNLNQVKFIHVRDYNSTLWGVPPNPTGGYTIAFRVDEDRNVLEYAVARVNNKDRYVKAIGRQVASERLSTPSAKVITMDGIRSCIDSVNKNAVNKLTVADLKWPVLINAISIHLAEEENAAKNKNSK